MMPNGVMRDKSIKSVGISGIKEGAEPEYPLFYFGGLGIVRDGGWKIMDEKTVEGSF